MNTSPFERKYKCKICGEIITEEWNQGVMIPTTSTYERFIHLLKHNFEELKGNS